MSLLILKNTHQVLKLHGISTLEVNGNLTAKQRQDSVTKFRQSNSDGPRVLILSEVGIVGLNLPCANILLEEVTLCYHCCRMSPDCYPQDTLWSAQQDRQLEGRVRRPPQKKIVHIYRIL